MSKKKESCLCWVEHLRDINNKIDRVGELNRVLMIANIELCYARRLVNTRFFTMLLSERKRLNKFIAQHSDERWEIKRELRQKFDLIEAIGVEFEEIGAFLGDDTLMERIKGIRMFKRAHLGVGT